MARARAQENRQFEQVIVCAQEQEADTMLAGDVSRLREVALCQRVLRRMAAIANSTCFSAALLGSVDETSASALSARDPCRSIVSRAHSSVRSSLRGRLWTSLCARTLSPARCRTHASWRSSGRVMELVGASSSTSARARLTLARAPERSPTAIRARDCQRSASMASPT